MPEPIDDYIRDNRGRYTREAIRENLITAGHDPTAVDQGWSRAEAVNAAESVPKGLSSRYWRLAIGAHLAAFVLVFLYLLTRPYAWNYLAGQIALVLLAIELLIGVRISGKRGRRLLATRGLAALSGPLISALVVGGSCLATARILGV